MFVVLILSILFLLTKKAFNSTFFDSKSIPSTRNIDSLTKELIRTRKNGKVEVQKIDAYLFTRLAALVLIFSGLINFNFYYIQSIGLSLGIFSGLFYVNHTSIIIESLIYMVGGLILFSWRPKHRQISTNYLSNLNDFPHLTRTLDLLPVSLEKEDGSREITNTFWEESPAKVLLDSKYYSDSTEKIDYSLIVLFSALGSSLLISSGDLISLYLSIELQSFSLYVLATLYKNSESSTSAGLKYFLLGGLSSCIILLGAGLIYSNCGLTNFESIYSLNSVLIQASGAENLTFDSMHVEGNALKNSTNNENILSLLKTVFTSNGEQIRSGMDLGYLLIFVGLLFKISAAPMHHWAPDVYQDTPTIVTTWLTIIPKLSIIILLLELFLPLFPPDIEFNTLLELRSYGTYVSKEDVSVGLLTLLFVSSALSLIIGTVLGLAQTKIKRLLAYSTISHIGFILLALGVQSSDSIESLIFYIIQYTITNLNIFLILITLSLIYNNIQNNKGKSVGGHTVTGGEDIEWISQLKGLYFINPYLSFSLIISLLSLAGIPPLLGFYAKQFTLYAALESGHYFLAVLAIVTSVISASYYLKIIRLNFSTDTYYKESAILMEGYNQEVIQDKYETTAGQIPNGQAPKTGAEFLEGAGGDKESTSSVIDMLPYPVSYFISFFTLFILIYAIKPSIISSSTGVLSLYLLGFLH